MSTNRSAASAPTTVSLVDEDAVKRIVTDTLFGLWATINNLTRLRPSKRERYRELANAGDIKIPQCVDNAAQAIAIIREHHARWQAAQGKRP